MFVLKNYHPHEAQQAFHYAITNLYRYVAYISGIRGGKTYSGAREAVRQAWNAKGKGVYGVVAPTYNMLDRTTWLEFIEAARPLLLSENKSDKIAILRNGRRVHGHSAEKPNRIRNETFVGFWCDEAREFKEFKIIWNILKGRVLSTGGKGIVTTSPNSFDDIHEIFVADKRPEYGVVKAPTYANTYLDKQAIDELKSSYDSKFAEQEIGGEFVLFEGQVYYTFNRNENAGSLALKLAQYDPNKPIELCCDFNVDPMAWVLTQMGYNKKGLAELYAVDEIFLRNSNTVECCKEFKTRYPRHQAGLHLYGDATGQARHTSSNVSNWQIIQEELKAYNPQKRVPLANPNERDRINSANAMICNSKGERRVFINPNRCKRLIRDLEQVPFKKGSCQIDKTKDPLLTHPSDALGYRIERDFSLAGGKLEGLKI